MLRRIWIVLALLLVPALVAAAQPTIDGYSPFIGTLRGQTPQSQVATDADRVYSDAMRDGLDFLIYSGRDPRCGSPDRERLQEAHRAAAKATQEGQFVALVGADWGARA